MESYAGHGMAWRCNHCVQTNRTAFICELVVINAILQLRVIQIQFWAQNNIRFSAIDATKNGVQFTFDYLQLNDMIKFLDANASDDSEMNNNQIRIVNIAFAICV